MTTTTDPNDPRLKREMTEGPEKQNDVYLVLSEEERARGFVRPLRFSYQHVGERPTYPIRPLNEEEQERFAGLNYIGFEAYPDELSPLAGRYWKRRQLHSGCGAVTTVAPAIAETYARDPHFYGATYCTGCHKHLPVSEFVWTDDGEQVGS
jgi:hypothetical protein